MGEASGGGEAVGAIEYGDGPRVLIFADSAEGTRRLQRTAALADCRILDAAAIEGAAERLSRQVCVEAVLVDLTRDSGAAQDRLLDRLEEGGCGSVVVTTKPLIDRVAAWTTRSSVHHLCDPNDLDLVATVAIASAVDPTRLHDVRKSPATARLQQLSEELGRVATVLASLSEDEATAIALVGGDAQESDAERIEPGEIRAMIRARRLRDHFFKSELFADPAWDMLLDLMAARLEKQRVAVSSLCIAAAVPPTTALRWIKALCDQGIFVRVADPEDGRRVFIELSDASAAAMENYLRAANRISPQIV